MIKAVKLNTSLFLLPFYTEGINKKAISFKAESWHSGPSLDKEEQQWRVITDLYTWVQPKHSNRLLGKEKLKNIQLQMIFIFPENRNKDSEFLQEELAHKFTLVASSVVEKRNNIWIPRGGLCACKLTIVAKSEVDLVNSTASFFMQEIPLPLPGFQKEWHLNILCLHGLEHFCLYRLSRRRILQGSCGWKNKRSECQGY